MAEIQTLDSSESGMSLVDVTIAIVLFGLGALMALSLTVSSLTLDYDNRETATVTAAMRELVEEMQSIPLSQVYANYNDRTYDDPDGDGTAPGSSFIIVKSIEAPREVERVRAGDQAAADTLEQRSSMQDMNIQVRIEFPTDENGNLSELGNAADGLPMDMNGDGELTAGDRSEDYNFLPVTITLSWQGSRGTQSFSIPRILAQ